MADPALPTTLVTCPLCGATNPRDVAHSCPKPEAQRPELVATLAPEAPVDERGATQRSDNPVVARPPTPQTVPQNKSADIDDLVGTVINDRFDIERRLSKGGMGVVYLARHRALDTQVAIKVLLRPRNEEDQVRFLLEAKIASRVKHANTVYISDFGQLPDGRNYLAMELLKGKPLSDEVGHGPMPVLRALRIAVQIARGLKAVHDLGIIHRDIKPANVFLVEQDGSPDFVKIVDFGIAKMLASGERPPSPLAAVQDADKRPEAAGGEVKTDGPPELTQPGTVMGTPAYMSPEQTRGEHIDAATDQYAFGCMLYQLLTGRTPFVGRNMMDVMMQHSDTAVLPVPPRELVGGLEISDALEQAILRMLAKLPAARFPSMAEVAEALEQELDLLLLARGDKRLLTAAHVEALEEKARAGVPTLAIGGLRIPVWMLWSALVVLICSVSAVGYFKWLAARRAERPHLRPGELLLLRERALVTLRDELAQPASGQRVAVVTAFGQSRDSMLSKELEPLLRDQDADVQAQAAKGLAELADPGALPALRAANEQALVPEVRVEVAGALHKLREPGGQPQLVAALDSAAPEVQFTAAMMLCDDSTAPRAQEILRTYVQLAQTPREVRQSILACQAQSGSSAARQALTELARVRGPEQVAAAGWLWQLGDEPSREILRHAVRQGGAEGLHAARLLAATDELESLELLAEVVKNPAANLAARQLAADGLGDGGDTFYARLLADYLTPRPQVEPLLRITAAGSIVRLAAQDPSSLSANSLRWAQGALTDRSWLVRQAAVAVLADATSPEAVPLLVRLAKDADPRLRRSALRALGRRHEPAALIALREGLADAELSGRLVSIRSLGRILSGQRGAVSAQSEPVQWLRAHFDRATVAEQVAIGGVLEQLGDSSHRAQMLALLDSPDEALRRLVVASQAAGEQTAVRALGDAVLAIRLAAAQQLASRGDARAVAVLREAVQLGGADGVAAYGGLVKLGQVTALPVDLEQSLRAAAVDKRLAAVTALATLPPDVALPLLTRAVHDPDAQVRRRAAVVAASWPTSSAGQAILRRLLADRDPAVRARAQALLARPTGSTKALDPEDEEEEPEPVRTGDNSPSPPPSTLAKVEDTADNEPEPAADLELHGDKGLLVIESDVRVLYQLDHRPWQATTGQPIAVAPGPHHLSAMSGQQDFTAVVQQRVTVHIAASRSEQLAHAGQLSLQRRDYRKAQRQLEQAISLCGQDNKNATPCAILSFDMRYTLGQIRETQLEWPEAMNEYQKTLALAHHIKGKAEIKAQTEHAITRLLPHVCKVVIRQQVGHRCVEETVWVGPGHQLIKVGGKLQQVEAQVQQVQQVGTCG